MEGLRKGDGGKEGVARAQERLPSCVASPMEHSASAAAAQGEASGALSYVAAIDQGTTSTRFIVYDTSAKVVASHQLEFTQIYPQAGYFLFPPFLALFLSFRVSLANL